MASVNNQLNSGNLPYIEFHYKTGIHPDYHPCWDRLQGRSENRWSGKYWGPLCSRLAFESELHQVVLWGGKRVSIQGHQRFHLHAPWGPWENWTGQCLVHCRTARNLKAQVIQFIILKVTATYLRNRVAWFGIISRNRKQIVILLGDGVMKVLGDALIFVVVVQEVDLVPKAKLGFPIEANKVRLVDIASAKYQTPSAALLDLREESGICNINIFVVVKLLGPSLSSLCGWILNDHCCNGIVQCQIFRLEHLDLPSSIQVSLQ